MYPLPARKQCGQERVARFGKQKYRDGRWRLLEQLQKCVLCARTHFAGVCDDEYLHIAVVRHDGGKAYQLADIVHTGALFAGAGNMDIRMPAERKLAAGLADAAGLGFAGAEQRPCAGKRKFKFADPGGTVDDICVGANTAPRLFVKKSELAFVVQRYFSPFQAEKAPRRLIYRCIVSQKRAREKGFFKK